MHPLSGQTLILLPGIDGTKITFEPFLQVLPQDVTAHVIAYPADKLMSFKETVQYVRDRIPADRKILLLAESFSGPVAVALLASGHIQATGLILAATFARSPRPVILKTLNHLPIVSILKLPLPRTLLKHVISGGEKTTDLFIDLVNKVRAIVPAKTLAHRLKVVDEVDVSGLLHKINIPCLYLQASSDSTVPHSCLNDFIQAVADLRVKRIQGPHFIIQAMPQECLDAIQDFAVALEHLHKSRF